MAQTFKQIYANPEKCTGCKYCELWCSYHLTKKFHRDYSAIKVTNPKTGANVPIACRQCDQAFCEKVCPVNAIAVNKKTGAHEINTGRSVQCAFCVDACRTGTITKSKEGIILCDLCNGDPLCVKHCPTDALAFYTPQEAVTEARWKKAKEFIKLVKS